jgi:hypothetical protein
LNTPAQEQGHKPLATAVSLTPAADNQGFRHPMASQLATGNSRNTHNVKENVMSTKAKMHQTTVYDSGRGSRRDRKKKDEAKMSRERVENMAANEACRVGQSRAIRNDLARLSGMRFAPCAEVNTGKYLDESMVKRVTGYDQ